jgi:membrane-bound ClpP family serine protease
LVLGLVYVMQKIVGKKIGQSMPKLLTERRQFWYGLHTNGSKLSVLLAFAHGLTIIPVDQTYTITGWVLGITLIVLTLLGAFLSIKQNSKPMSLEDDAKWKTIRIIKWILTILVFPLIALHYFY